ncbi:MAG TPA: hypothetical protein VEB20_12785 [Azospirillaceae bacterium]|nr:hypothetical protein [Azospirillaceae bacterium]
MKYDLDTMLVGVQMVREMGPDAVTVARNRLVELIAANNLRAAAFWREVMKVCEAELAKAAPPPPAGPEIGPSEQPALH